MLKVRLDPERHGSAGFTTIPRVVAIGTAVAFVVVAVQLGVSGWYNGRMLPGVVIGNRSVGNMTLAQARQEVADEVAQYRLMLDVAGEKYSLTASQLGVTFDTEQSIEQGYASGRSAWLPPFHQDPVPLAYDVNRQQLNDFATSVEQRVGTQPVDASLTVKGATVSAVPDRDGYTIDRVGLEQLVEDDVRMPGGTTVLLKPRTQTADIQATMLAPTIAEAQQLMATPVVLSYGTHTYAPTQAQIGQWLAFVKQPDGLKYKLVPQVDMSKLQAYVAGLAKKLDSAPTSELITMINGSSTIERQGVNGTGIDQDAVVAAIAQAVTAQQPLTYTITDHAVPYDTVSTTLVPLGLPQYVEVNLTRQHLWVWQDGQVIYDSPVTTGATGAGFATVTGLFHVYDKRTNTHLIGTQYGPAYNYDVFVQYWMAFYSGYGLHDASWRNGNFGETSGPYGYYYDGSHGCVNLPLATAQFLYGWTTIGTPVWVHN